MIKMSYFYITKYPRVYLFYKEVVSKEKERQMHG